MSTLKDTLQPEYTSSARIYFCCTEVMKILILLIDTGKNSQGFSGWHPYFSAYNSKESYK